MSEKRFFEMDDGGADYIVVALGQEHAERIMRNAGIDFADGVSYDTAKENGLIRWEEMPKERAIAKRVHRNDGDGQDPVPLVQCEIGDWFCSEW